MTTTKKQRECMKTRADTTSRMNYFHAWGCMSKPSEFEAKVQGAQVKSIFYWWRGN